MCLCSKITKFSNKIQILSIELSLHNEPKKQIQCISKTTRLKGALSKHNIKKNRNAIRIHVLYTNVLQLHSLVYLVCCTQYNRSTTP